MFIRISETKIINTDAITEINEELCEVRVGGTVYKLNVDLFNLLPFEVKQLVVITDEDQMTRAYLGKDKLKAVLPGTVD